MRKEISPGLAAAVIILVVVVALVVLLLFTNPGRRTGTVDTSAAEQIDPSEVRPRTMGQ